MSDYERLKEEFVAGVKDLEGAAKEAIGKLTGSEKMVEGGQDDQHEAGVPHDGAHPDPSHEPHGGAAVSGEKSGREW